MEDLLKAMGGGGGAPNLPGMGDADKAALNQLWAHLDELAAERPEEYEKFIKSQMEQGAEMPKEDIEEALGAFIDPKMLNFETIEPSPAFVAKTVDGIGKKFFLNVCSHDAVDKPRPLEGSDRVGQDASAEEYRYPMSLGAPRDVTDKQGRRSRACDVIFNPETVSRAAADRATRDFIVELAFSAFEQKHDKESLCRAAHVKFPNLRYKGAKVEKQRIRKKGVAPGAEPGLREEFKGKKGGGAPEIVTKEPALSDADVGIAPESVVRRVKPEGDAAARKVPGKTPKFTMELRFDDDAAVAAGKKGRDNKKRGKGKGTDAPSGPPTSMVFAVDLPGVETGEAGAVSVKVDATHLRVAAGAYALEAELPFTAVPATSRTYFDKDNKRLVALVPCA